MAKVPSNLFPSCVQSVEFAAVAHSDTYERTGEDFTRHVEASHDTLHDVSVGGFSNISDILPSSRQVPKQYLSTPIAHQNDSTQIPLYNEVPHLSSSDTTYNAPSNCSGEEIKELQVTPSKLQPNTALQADRTMQLSLFNIAQPDMVPISSLKFEDMATPVTHSASEPLTPKNNLTTVARALDNEHFSPVASLAQEALFTPVATHAIASTQLSTVPTLRRLIEESQPTTHHTAASLPVSMDLKQQFPITTVVQLDVLKPFSELANSLSQKEHLCQALLEDRRRSEVMLSDLRKELKASRQNNKKISKQGKRTVKKLRSTVSELTKELLSITEKLIESRTENIELTKRVTTVMKQIM